MKSFLLFCGTWAAISVLVAALFVIYERVGEENVRRKWIVLSSLATGLIFSLARMGILARVFH